jgi:hypothetical protein
MNGIPYKDTFAAKGSQLYAALADKDEKKAKQIYALTTASAYALLHRLQVPKLVVGTEGKSKGVWAIMADDAVYDNSGRFKEMK